MKWTTCTYTLTTTKSLSVKRQMNSVKTFKGLYGKNLKNTNTKTLCAQEPRKNNYEITNALDGLDTQILYLTILKPILGIEDLRNDQRISYAHGRNDLAYVKMLVDSGEYQVGFGLIPVSTEEMKHLADEGLKMPPKSTYIEPKLRSGVTIYEF